MGLERPIIESPWGSRGKTIKMGELHLPAAQSPLGICVRKQAEAGLRRKEAFFAGSGSARIGPQTKPRYALPALKNE
jgi:hypothetical protein